MNRKTGTRCPISLHESKHMANGMTRTELMAKMRDLVQNVDDKRPSTGDLLRVVEPLRDNERVRL